MNCEHKATLQKMIENMKGVLNTRIKSIEKTDTNTNKWMEQLKELRESIDSSLIDYNDDKTNYILS